MQVDDRLGLVADRFFGIAVVVPHGDDHEGQQDRVEHADHGEFEAGDLVVET